MAALASHLAWGTSAATDVETWCAGNFMVLISRSNARGERLGKSWCFFPVRSTAWLGAAWGRRSTAGTTPCLLTLPAWRGGIVRFAAVGDATVSTARVPPAPRRKRASPGPA